MRITKEVRRQPDGVPLLKELKGTDFLIIAHVENELGPCTVEYTLELKANFVANAIHAAITIISVEQGVEPCEVIVSHVAMRHATTGVMIKVL